MAAAKNTSKVNVTLIVLLSIIIFLTISYITMRFAHKPSFDWWYAPDLANNANNRINGKKYSNMFNISSMFAWQTSTPLFWILNFMSPPSTRLNASQYRFLYEEIMPFALHVLDKQAYGIITPKSLCETVLIKTEDGDWDFNFWYSDPNNRTRQDHTGSKIILDETVKLDSTQIQSFPITTHDNVQYMYYARTNDGTQKVGLYAGVDDSQGWATVFLDWLNFDQHGKGQATTSTDEVQNNSWVLRFNKDKIWYPYWYSTDTKSVPNVNNWYNRPDNFLGRMHITYDSPLAVYFINDVANVGSLHVNATAFNNLIGSGTAVAGGWVGYCHGMETSDADDLREYITSKVQDNAPQPPPPLCTPKANIAGGLITGFLSAISIGVMAVMAPEAAPAILAAAAVSGGLAGYQAGKPTC